MLLFKFFSVIVILEGYFIITFVQSDNFLQISLDMINEASAITNRNFNNFFLYQLLIEILSTNGESNVLNQQSTEFI